MIHLLTIHSCVYHPVERRIEALHGCNSIYSCSFSRELWWRRRFERPGGVEERSRPGVRSGRLPTGGQQDRDPADWPLLRLQPGVVQSLLQRWRRGGSRETPHTSQPHHLALLRVHGHWCVSDERGEVGVPEHRSRGQLQRWTGLVQHHLSGRRVSAEQRWQTGDGNQPAVRAGDRRGQDLLWCVCTLKWLWYWQRGRKALHSAKSLGFSERFYLNFYYSSSWWCRNVEISMEITLVAEQALLIFKNPINCNSLKCYFYFRHFLYIIYADLRL